MTTPAEQEAERRYPDSTQLTNIGARQGFIAGAEWSESRYRELLEAAEAYRDGGREYVQAHFNDPAYATAVQSAYWKYESGRVRLLAAAAALEEA